MGVAAGRGRRARSGAALGGREKARVERDGRRRWGDGLEPLPSNKRIGPVRAVPAPARRTVIEGAGKLPANAFQFPKPAPRAADVCAARLLGC